MRYRVWSHPAEITYTTTLISKATVFYVLSGLLTVIPPLLIAYRSQGFWIKTATYTEQPEIHFKHSLLVLVEMRDGNGVVWSTVPWIMDQEADRVRLPVLKSREEDTNRDGLKDSLWFHLDFPLQPREEVIGVHALLLFQYQLHRFSSFEMTGLIYLTGQGQAGRRLDVSGVIGLHQRQPLAHRGRDTRYQSSPLAAAQPFQSLAPLSTASSAVAPLSLPAILKAYGQRNVTARLENDYAVWGSGPASGGHQRFILEANINYPAAQTVVYVPGLWQTLKWGWVQYLAILVIFVYVFNTVKTYVFYEQIVPTTSQMPWKQ